jgi:hypothetical protein
MKHLFSILLSVLFIKLSAQSIPQPVTELDSFPHLKCFKIRMQYYDSAKGSLDYSIGLTRTHCRDEKGRKVLDKTHYDDD